MKRISTSNGPFPTRLYFTNDEIEQIFSDALAQTGLLPSKPSPIRIDRFIEKKFDVIVIHEPLTKGVLGFTEFGPAGVNAIHVGIPTSELHVQEDRRINSTLAHEAGHGLMHAQLFIEHFANDTLFQIHPHVTQTKILCRDEQDPQPQRKYAGHWWEFQANRAIGALLMPRKLLPIFIEPFLRKFNAPTASHLSTRAQREVVEAASHIFDVNQMVARIRIFSRAL